MKQIIYKFTRVLIALLLVMGLMACGESKENEIEQQASENQPVELEPYTPLEESEVIEYEAKAMKPKVMTDLLGYEPGSDKVVICVGDIERQSFEVINNETGESVFFGMLEAGAVDEKSGEATYIGYFTGLTLEGKYHVRTDHLGESAPFEIRTGIESELFRESVLALGSLWNSDTVITCSDLPQLIAPVQNVLIALEYYTELLTDDLQIEESGNDIPDALDIVGRITDKVTELDTRECSAEELSAYVGIVSASAQGYKSFDKKKSEAYQAHAVSAYRELERRAHQEDEAEGARFYAASLLARVTGSSQYARVAEDYLKENAANMELGDYDYYGKVAYISSKYDVDRSLCSRVVAGMSEQVEKLCYISGRTAFMISNENVEEQYENITRIAIMNYMITNHEYVKLQGQHVHYMLGCNPDCVSYFDGYGDWKSDPLMTSSPKGVTSMILALCEVISEQAGTGL